MRAVKIDPYTREITELDIDGSLNSIYQGISSPMHKISVIEIGLSFPNGDDLYVDEEGLLTTGHKVFKLNGLPFVGCGLLLGTDEDGEALSAKTGLVDLQCYVGWTDLVNV
jgi:hypothetical protein